jgi:hypothetical protein
MSNLKKSGPQMVKDTVCRKCGAADSFFKHGKADSSKKQRYSCRDCGFRTTNPWDQQAPSIFKDRLPEGYDRYVITCAQNATGLFRPFFRSLLKYCEENRALLVVVPFRYQNPTSVWTNEQENNDWWNEEILPYLYQGEFWLNEKICVRADVPITPTKVSPLAGFDTLTGGASAIFGHPKLELKSIATPQNKLPKIIQTTGAVTKRNYIPSVAGKKGEFHHTYGATVVEIDGDVFHTRQINAVGDGSFYEIAGGKVSRYTGNRITTQKGVEALVMGDTHVDYIDPDVYTATFGKSGIIDALKPKTLVWHDVLDFYSRSHHHSCLTNIAKGKEGKDDVGAEIKRAVNFIIENTPKGTKSVVVPSNHDEHLGRWIKEADWKRDPVNAEVYLETALHMVRSAKMEANGASWSDPFHYWFNKLAPKHNVTLLSRDNTFTIKDIELSMHGDKGPNGSRGTLVGLSKIGVKSIIGHSHTPGIREGAYQTGTSSYLRLEYNSGPSSWMHSHCIVYPNGKRCLINIIGDTWRYDEGYAVQT